MKRQKCRVCGKLRLTPAIVPEKWVCSACRQKIREMMESPTEGPKRACPKCKLLKKENALSATGRGSASSAAINIFIKMLTTIKNVGRNMKFN